MTDEEITQLQQELEGTKAELAARDATLAEAIGQVEGLRSQLNERDALIGPLKEQVQSLSAQVTESDSELTALKAEMVLLDGLNQRLGQAVGSYRTALAAANPTIPGDLIKGESVPEIDASLETAKAIVEKVKASIEAAAAQARVPAGAPARTGVDVESLTPTEKIKLGIRQGQR